MLMKAKLIRKHWLRYLINHRERKNYLSIEGVHAMLHISDDHTFQLRNEVLTINLLLLMIKVQKQTDVNNVIA